MDGAGQTEKNKMVRKENFISSLRIYYKQCQILKMRKDSGSRQPAVTVTRRATGEPLARAGGPRRGAEPAGPEPRAAGHAAHGASGVAGRAQTQPRGCPCAGEERTRLWGRQRARGARGPAGRAQGAPQMQGTGLRSCLPPSGASQLGLRAGAPCCAGHREATPGLACPPRARDSSGPGQSWCRVSREGAQSHEPHPSQVPRPPEPQFPPCKTGHLQVQVREEARDRRGKLVTHREPQGGPSRAPVPGTRVAGAAVASLAF